MSDKSTGCKAGIGFTGNLQVAFIVLKLCGVIDWAWWKVFLPFIIEAAILVVAAILIIPWRVKK